MYLPEDLQRGEYSLCPTDDGIIELGCTGSILRALNKVITIFAQKNDITPVPVFPEPPKTLPSMVITKQGWAKLEKSQKKNTKGENTRKEGDVEYEDAQEEWAEEPEEGYEEGNDDDVYDLDKLDKDDTDDFAYDAGGGEYNQTYDDYMFDCNGGYTDPGLGGLDFTSQPKLNLLKYIEKLKAVHKPFDKSFGRIDDPTGEVIIRIGVNVSTITDSLLAKIWHIRFDLPIIIELTLTEGFMESTYPPQLRVYQTSQTDLNKRKITTEVCCHCTFKAKHF